MSEGRGLRAPPFAIAVAAPRGLNRSLAGDLVPPTTDEHGRWLSWGRDHRGRVARFRRTDGIHLTDPGGLEVTCRLMPLLSAAGL